MSFTSVTFTNPSSVPTGSAVYVRFVRQSDGKFANQDTETLDTYDAADIADYGLGLVELGTSATWQLTVSAWLPAASYAGYIYRRIGATQAATDPLVGILSTIEWNGSSAADLNTIIAEFAEAIIVVTSPVATDGSISIVQGDSYTTANGRALTWTVATASLPDMTGADVSIGLATPANYVKTGFETPALEVAGTISTNGANTIFTIEFSAAQTAGLSTALDHNCAEAYVYQLRVELGSGELYTIQLGNVAVTKRTLPQPAP
jgi:hypothetical protein